MGTGAGSGWHLIAAGAALVILAVATLIEERRKSTRTTRQARLTHARLAEDAHLAQLTGREPATPVRASSPGHEHGEGSRVAWLLTAPVAAIFLIAPSALGSYAAQQAPPPAPPALVDAQPVRPLKSDRVNVLSLAEFADRAWYEPIRSLAGKTVRLTGFVLPSPTKAEDTWVRVTGTWIPREGRPSDTYVPAMTASDVHPISPPVEPYE
ncbi:hypothetical protein [Nonomuraea angiospora]|uniref:hypothetical protein n=1 Tax=Nonomuraea angiospora TaxID=46172 RepID=UPI0029B68975|nr:hypothetical protein [Nonomuraea angiospora]MDX3100176.1 hypothetical protein [Nonomuraea angiospora]